MSVDVSPAGTVRRTNDLPLLALMGLGFVGLGMLDGAAGTLWTDVLHAFDVSKGAFGVASGIGLGIAFPVLLFGGVLADRMNKRTLLVVAFVLMAAFSLGLTSGHGAVLLGAWLLVRGLGVSLLDLANNALAVDYERGTGRHIMSPLHASYSAGTVLGPILVWVVIQLDGGHRVVYAGLGALYVALAVASLILRRRPLADWERSDHTTPLRMALLTFSLLRNSAFRTLALICATCFLGEILIGQWAGLYLRDERGLSSTVGVLAIGCYGAAMLIGRIANGPLTARVRPRGALFAMGSVTVAGGLLIALAGPPAMAIAGCALAGLGLAGMVPTALSLAGVAVPSASGVAAGVILAVAYLALVVGPLVAGGVATAISLRAVMVGEILCGLAVIALASRVPNESERS